MQLSGCATHKQSYMYNKNDLPSLSESATGQGLQFYLTFCVRDQLRVAMSPCLYTVLLNFKHFFLSCCVRDQFEDCHVTVLI